jgi:hypothetical protein
MLRIVPPTIGSTTIRNTSFSSRTRALVSGEPGALVYRRIRRSGIKGWRKSVERMVIAALMLIVPSPAPDIRRRTPARSFPQGLTSIKRRR